MRKQLKGGKETFKFVCLKRKLFIIGKSGKVIKEIDVLIIMLGRWPVNGYEIINLQMNE